MSDISTLPASGPKGPGRRGFLLGAGAALCASASRAAPAARTWRLAWQPALASNLAVAVAQGRGLFTANGADVELVPVEGGPGVADSLRDGRADACVGAALSLLPALQTRLEAKLTAGVSGGGLRLLAERRSKLRHIEDMKGRSIGVGRLDGSGKLFFSIMLRRKGIDPFREVTWVELAPAAQADALAHGAVDAIEAPDAAGFELRETMKLVEIATDISGSYRDRTGQVLACSAGLLRDDPAAAAGLTRALVQAAASIAHDPASAAGIASAFAPSLSDADRVRMIRAEAHDQHPVGPALVEDIAAYADELRLLGVFPYALNAGKFARSVCQVVT